MKSFAKWILVYSCVVASAPLALAETGQSTPRPGTVQFKVGESDVYLGGQYLDGSQVTKDGYLAAAGTERPIEFNEGQQVCIQRQLETFSRYISETTDPRKLEFLKALKPKSLSVYLRDFTAGYKPDFKNPAALLFAIKPSVMLDDANHSVAFTINHIYEPSGASRCLIITNDDLDRAIAYKIALQDSVTGSYAELKSAATELFGKLASAKPSEAAKSDADATDSQLIQRGRDAAAKLAQEQTASPDQAAAIR